MVQFPWDSTQTRSLHLFDKGPQLAMTQKIDIRGTQQAQEQQPPSSSTLVALFVALSL